jgi:signal peptidase I
MDSPDAKPQTPKANKLLVALCVSGALTIGLPIVLAIGLRLFVIEAFKVPSGAMTPSIVPGDHLFAEKGAYRNRAPRRGEVFIFQFPERPAQDFVKRGIAIGGDRLEIRDGHPILNGWQVPFCRVGPYAYVDDSGETGVHRGELFVEFLETSAYLVFLDGAQQVAGTQGPYTVAPGETWVLGDNRNNSYDSRLWFGGRGAGVPRSHVRGRARWVWRSAVPGQTGKDLAADPVAPTPELAAPLAACLAKRPNDTTPPPAK